MKESDATKRKIIHDVGGWGFEALFRCLILSSVQGQHVRLIIETGRCRVNMDWMADIEGRDRQDAELIDVPGVQVMVLFHAIVYTGSLSSSAPMRSRSPSRKDKRTRRNFLQDNTEAHSWRATATNMPNWTAKGVQRKRVLLLPLPLWRWLRKASVAPMQMRW